MNSTIKVEIPISMRWKISKEEIQTELEETPFSVEMFKIEEFPKIQHGLVISKTEENEITVGFGILKQKPINIQANFKISIIPANIFKNGEQYFEHRSAACEFTLCKWEELFDPANNYFINDYMYITLEGILCFENEQTEEIYGIPDIKSPSNLGELLWNRDDKDFDISVDDGKIVKVHKLIISAKSPVFEKMLESGLKETKESKVTIIDFDFETVEIAMKYFYGISITKFLNVSIGINLLQFSDKYDISDLKNSMEEYLFQQKSPINVCEIVNASILVNSIKLREECFDFMLNCMKESIFIKDLDILDKEFSLNLLKASFTCLKL